MQVILQQKKGPANSSPRISNYDAQSNSVLHRQIHRLESFRNPEMLLCTVWAYPLPQGLVAALESVVTSSSDVSAVPDEICDSSGTIVVALSSLSTAVCD